MLPFFLLRNTIPKIIITIINTQATPPTTPTYMALDEDSCFSENMHTNIIISINKSTTHQNRTMTHRMVENGH